MISPNSIDNNMITNEIGNTMQHDKNKLLYLVKTPDRKSRDINPIIKNGIYRYLMSFPQHNLPN